MPVAKFQELRYNIALILKEMNDLEKRSVLKIQDWTFQLVNEQSKSETLKENCELQNEEPAPFCMSVL